MARLDKSNTDMTVGHSKASTVKLFIYIMTSLIGNIFALLSLCEGNPPATGGFPSQRSVTRSFGVFFDLHLNKWLSKQWRRRWFEMPSHWLWHHCNDIPNAIDLLQRILIYLGIYIESVKATIMEIQNTVVLGKIKSYLRRENMANKTRYNNIMRCSNTYA